MCKGHVVGTCIQGQIQGMDVGGCRGGCSRRLGHSRSTAALLLLLVQNVYEEEKMKKRLAAAGASPKWKAPLLGKIRKVSSLHRLAWDTCFRVKYSSTLQPKAWTRNHSLGLLMALRRGAPVK